MNLRHVLVTGASPDNENRNTILRNYVADGFRAGMTVEEIFSLSKIDPWFLHQVKQIVEKERELREQGAAVLAGDGSDLGHPLRQAKEWGFSDRRIAKLLTTTEDAVRTARKKLGIMPDCPLRYLPNSRLSGPCIAMTPSFRQTSTQPSCFTQL